MNVCRGTSILRQTISFSTISFVTTLRDGYCSNYIGVKVTYQINFH
jgi:hypothetical protein